MQFYYSTIYSFCQGLGVSFLSTPLASWQTTIILSFFSLSNRPAMPQLLLPASLSDDTHLATLTVNPARGPGRNRSFESCPAGTWPSLTPSFTSLRDPPPASHARLYASLFLCQIVPRGHDRHVGPTRTQRAAIILSFAPGVKLG